MASNHPVPLSEVRVTRSGNGWRVWICEGGETHQRTFAIREFAYSFAADQLARLGLSPFRLTDEET